MLKINLNKLFIYLFTINLNKSLKTNERFHQLSNILKVISGVISRYSVQQAIYQNTFLHVV